MSAGTAPMADSAAASDLTQRILSGLVLAAVALAAIWMGFPVFELAVLAAMLIGAFEWRRLCDLSGHWGGWIVIATAPVVLSTAIAVGIRPAVGGVVVGGGAVVLLGLLSDRQRRLLWTGVGVVYLGLPAVGALYLRADPVAGLGLLLWLVVVVAASDVGAFAGGRTIGGPRLAPAISPAKTWSGAVAGLLSAVVAGVTVAWLVQGPPGLAAAALAAGVSVVAQLGDLFESFVKRRHGRKDSGSLIPGHGGILDRVDGFLFATPMFALLTWRGYGPFLG